MKLFSTSIAFAVVLGLPGGALAQGAYIGLGVGQSSYDVVNSVCDSIDSLRPPGVTADCQAEDSDTSVSLFGGYEINDYFAAELGYMDLGQVSNHVRIIEGGIGASIDGTVEANGIYLAAVGRLPMGERAAFILKAGVMDIDQESRVDAAIAGLPASSQGGEASGTEAIYGVGIDINASERIRVRLQYERIDLEDAIDNVSLALIGRF